MVAITEQRRLFCELLINEVLMKDNNARFHFINVVKVSKDFLGEHYAPLSESDCIALCAQKNIVESINEALSKAGIEGLKVQLNWSADNGNSWVQYPKSR